MRCFRVDVLDHNDLIVAVSFVSSIDTRSLATSELFGTFVAFECGERIVNAVVDGDGLTHLGRVSLSSWT